MDIKIIPKDEFLKLDKAPNQEVVWDSIAGAWNKYVVKKIPIIQDFLKNKKGKIIDLGCGDGRNMIPNSNIEYYGIDFSQSSLNHAKKRCKREKVKCKIFKSKVDKLNKKIFKNNMFNAGLFIAALHCLETPQERLNSLKEFHRVLKPKAQAIITIWNSEDKRFKCVNNKGDIYMSWKDKGVLHMRYYYLFKKDKFFKLLDKAGFKILEFYEPMEKDRFSKKNWIVRVGKI